MIIKSQNLNIHGKIKGTGALKDRMAEDWKVVATLGARYGFFNPYRMANKPTSKMQLR